MKKNIIGIILILSLGLSLHAQELTEIEGSAKIDTLKIGRASTEINNAGSIFAFSNSNGGYLKVNAHNAMIFESGIGNTTSANIQFRTPAPSSNHMTLSTNGGVGINDRPAPVEKLDVNGAIRIGANDNENAGTIRYLAGDFEGHDGNDWKSLTSGGATDELIDNDGDTKIALQEGGSDKISMTVSGSEKIRIDTNTHGQLNIQFFAPESSLYLGQGSGNNSSGITNTAVGTWALQSNTSGFGNTALGFNTLQANTTGIFNTAVGREALQESAGRNNTSVGAKALSFLETGFRNTAIGGRTGFPVNGASSDNVFVGYSAGSLSGGTPLHEKSNNTMIGSHAGYNSTSSNNVFIGYRAGQDENENNRLYIHNDAADEFNALIYGEFDIKLIRLNGQVNFRDIINIPPRNSEPATPSIGHVYMDDGTNTGGTPTLRYWNGTTWVNL